MAWRATGTGSTHHVAFLVVGRSPKEKQGEHAAAGDAKENLVEEVRLSG